MPIKPIDLNVFDARDRNIHESIVVASRRARQINEEMKIEFNQRIEMLTVKPESETEENDVNPDQLKVALEFEKRAKPTDLALQDLMSNQIEFRYIEKEEAPPAKVEEEEEPEEE